MKRTAITKNIILASLIIVIAIIALLVINYPKLNANTVSTPSSNSPSNAKKVVVTQDNLGQYLQSQSIIKELPKDAIINLKVGDSAFTLGKSTVKTSFSLDPDITLTLPSSYLSSLSAGLCNTIGKANANGDLGATYHKSSTSLAWKYKSLYKYKDCL